MYKRHLYITTLYFALQVFCLENAKKHLRKKPVVLSLKCNKKLELSKMRRKLFVLTAMLLAVILLFSACGNTAANTTTETTEGLPVNIMQKSNPAEDDELNILMIGNSFCYYYVEELYGMLEEQYPDKTVRVCNVYQSGCTVEQHYTWWKNGESNYSYFTTDENGRKEVKNTNLAYCLSQQNWDVISLQGGASRIYKNGIAPETHFANNKTCFDELWTYIKQQFPMSRHLWHLEWTYQIGYDRGGYQMKTLEQQEENIRLIGEYGKMICQTYGVEGVNTGSAWQLVRQGGYDNLCARKSVNNGEGDYYHDGDIGGGQYLNACVWFETLTGQSCVGTTYRPDYTLDENITYEQLQEAAHKAVQNLNANK